MKNIKLKLMLILTIFLFLISTSFSAIINVTSCPTFASGNTYVLELGYSGLTCTITTDDVIITSNGVDILNSISFQLSSRNNITFDNIKTSNFGIDVSGTNTLITISNNHFYDFVGRSITGSGGVSGLIVRPSTSGGSSFITDLTINNNYIYSNSFSSQNDNIFGVYAAGGTSEIDLTNTLIYDNDFINLNAIFYINAGGGDTGNIDIHSTFTSMNNIYDTTLFSQTSGAGSKNLIIPSVSNCNVSFSNTDMLTYITYTTDANLDFRNDALTTLSSGSCNYINSNMLTQKKLNNIDNLYAVALSMGSPNYYSLGRDYLLVKSLSLDLTKYINFQSTQFSNLYLIPTDTLSVTTTNSIRMGANNGIIGYSGTQPKILVTGTIDETYLFSDPFATNWNIVSYTSGLTIHNIEFEGGISGNYGYIKSTTNGNGDFLTITNSLFDTNGVMTQPKTPVILNGEFAYIFNNSFDIRGSHQRVFRTTTNAGGGIYQDNLFIGAGLVFQDMTTSGASFVTLVNNNRFGDGGSFTSLPFNLTSSTGNTQSSFKLNGDYAFTTICDRYIFNIGNWYDDYSDTGSCVDANNDDICDSPLLRSDAGDNLTDNFVLQTFPYDFASNTGSIIPQNICGSFVYNVINPINNTNYVLSGGAFFTIDFEFISSAYPEMNCFVNLNDNTQLLMGVNSQENMVLSYQLNTGIYNFDATCSNDYIEFNTGNYNFTINSGTTYVSPPNPTIDIGGSGSGPGGPGFASGQGINSSINDIFITGFFTGNINDDSSGIVELFTLFETPLGFILLFAFVFLAFAIVIGIFSLGSILLGRLFGGN